MADIGAAAVSAGCRQQQEGAGFSILDSGRRSITVESSSGRCRTTFVRPAKCMHLHSRRVRGAAE